MHFQLSIYISMFSLLILILATATTATVVKINVLSSETPSWSISSLQEAALNQLIAKKDVSSTQFNIMGYTGFSVGDDNKVVYNNMEAELYLLKTMPVGLLSDSVLAHAMKRIINPSRTTLFERVPDKALHSQATCDNVIGPDTVPKYDPKNDDGGCFLSKVSDNNCYNYGNDIVTNTFSQPGRGTDKKWTANTCEAVTAAAISDGLISVGTTLPTDIPSEGHYVSLHIWPNSNFHWIRMDVGNVWSHKPGGTAVRNVDNNNKAITDPSQADFAPWTQFCGYFLTVPSTITIN